LPVSLFELGGWTGLWGGVAPGYLIHNDARFHAQMSPSGPVTRSSPLGDAGGGVGFLQSLRLCATVDKSPSNPRPPKSAYKKKKKNKKKTQQKKKQNQKKIPLTTCGSKVQDKYPQNGAGVGKTIRFAVEMGRTTLKISVSVAEQRFPRANSSLGIL